MFADKNLAHRKIPNYKCGASYVGQRVDEPKSDQIILGVFALVLRIAPGIRF
jgi:hypothetical protein